MARARNNRQDRHCERSAAIQFRVAGLLRRFASRNDEFMDPAAPLLFFDSGVGGLSVLEPTRRLLPTAPIVYVADNAGFPYGERSEADHPSTEDDDVGAIHGQGFNRTISSLRAKRGNPVFSLLG